MDRSRFRPFPPSALSLLPGLLVLALAGPALADAGASPGTTPTEELEGIFADAIPADGPGGAVIVVRNGEVVFRGAYGLANLELGVEARPEHVFRIASLTNQFTATAIMMLVERGEVALDDPITRFLPDYPAGDTPITVHHLLTHSSGVFDVFQLPDWEAIKRREVPRDLIIKKCGRQPARFAPGGGFEYSNTGYLLLGAIIEHVSGSAYEEFLQQNIFTPLGMDDTSVESMYRVIPGRAFGYGEVDGDHVRAGFLNMALFAPAGGIRSTVDDLARWQAALVADRVVSPETLALMWEPHVQLGVLPIFAGYGWFVSELEGRRMLAQSGGINGFSTYALILPEENLFVAVLLNHGNPKTSPKDLAKGAASLILKGE